jgi:hypothetical protein
MTGRECHHSSAFRTTSIYTFNLENNDLSNNENQKIKESLKIECTLLGASRSARTLGQELGIHLNAKPV